MNTSLFHTRILVVEDEHFMRMLAVQALESVGFRTVHEAEDGEDALGVMAKEDIDLLLTDIEMQPLNGLELAKRVRAGQTPLRRSTPVVFLSGLGDVATLTAASELDVHGFMVKPMSANQIRDKIDEALKLEVRLREPLLYQGLTFSSANGLVRRKGGRDLPGYTVTTTTPSRPVPVHTTAQQFSAEPEPADQIEAPPGTYRVTLPIEKLQPGMTLCEDIVSRGVIMLSKNSTLSPGHILVLRDMRKMLEKSEYVVLVPENQMV
jgi:two-component system chemotaxis response regulator CheY